MKLDHVAIVVKDLNRAIIFYSLLGFKKIGEFERDGQKAVFVGNDKSKIELFESQENHVKNKAYHYCFLVKDLDKTWHKLREKGIYIEQPEKGITVKKYCYLKDIDGNNIELCER